MSDDFVRVAPDSTGKRIDNSKITRSGEDYFRQRVVLSDPDDPYSHLVPADLTLEVGAWGYAAGDAGTVVVPAGARVIGIGCHATTAGSFSIDGGDSVPVPANVGVDLAPRGNLVAPTIVFVGTDSYFVEYVT